MLAVAREDIIHYLQLCCVDSAPSFKLLKKVKVNYHIASFKVSSIIVVVKLVIVTGIFLVD